VYASRPPELINWNAVKFYAAVFAVLFLLGIVAMLTTDVPQPHSPKLPPSLSEEQLSRTTSTTTTTPTP
jgi:hypothetical protein